MSIPPAPRPEAVIFDLGRVLLDFDYGRAARGLASRSQLPPEAIRLALDQSPLLIELESGRMTPVAFFEAVKKAIGFEGSLCEFESIFADIFTPIDEMIAVQGRLVDAGVPTFAFSNTNGIAVAHIAATYPFFSRFKARICSHDHKAMKPEPSIYEDVERITGLRGPRLLYLDDRLENIEAGVGRGWQTIHVTDAPAAARQLASRFGW